MKQGTTAISERPAAAPSGRCRPDIVAQTGPLRYVCEPDIGITRMRGPDGFVYRHPTGRVVRNRATLERIRDRKSVV
jgi:hypothetical protein